MTQEALNVLEKIVALKEEMGDGKRVNRLLEFLKPHDDESQQGWFFYVPLSFNEALDIELTPRRKDKVQYWIWTQGGWFYFKRGPNTPSKTQKALEQLVAEVLKEGSPFDDPLPEVAVVGTVFCFTGQFEFGKRKECQAAIISRGGTITDDITGKTDVLVIGNDPNPNWSHGS